MGKRVEGKGKERLTERQLRAVKCGEKQTKLSDGGGLVLQVGKTKKDWRLRFTHEGRAIDVSLGHYPQISLAKARELVKEKLIEIKNTSIDEFKEAIKSVNEPIQIDYTFEEFFYKRYIPHITGDVTDGHIRTLTSTLKNNIFPQIGFIKLTEISKSVIFNAIENVESSGKKASARKCYFFVRDIINFASSADIISAVRAVELNNIKDSIKKQTRLRTGEEMEGITDIEEFKKLMNDLYNDDNCTKSVYYASIIIAHWATRVNELVRLEWSEIDFNKGIVVIPAERMKGEVGERYPHIIPLTNEVKRLLIEIKEMKLSSKYVFPQSNGTIIDPEKHISIESIRNHLKKLGYKETQKAHGFRRSLATICKRQFDFPLEIIDQQLHHKTPSDKGTIKSYIGSKKEKSDVQEFIKVNMNSRDFEKRINMLNVWSEYIETAK